MRSSPPLLARQRAGFDLDRAADRLGVATDRLKSWEDGSAHPTVRQAKDLTHKFGQPFAALYLPEPPDVSLHLPRDYRRHAGARLEDISPVICLDVERSWDRREIALELSASQNTPPRPFDLRISLTDDQDRAGAILREALKVAMAEQLRWRDPRVAFNSWREHVEDVGVLVLQTSTISADELRAYSLFGTPLPVIVLNRKDAYAARTLSLLHELARRNSGDLKSGVETTQIVARASCSPPNTEISGEPPCSTWLVRCISLLGGRLWRLETRSHTLGRRP